MNDINFLIKRVESVDGFQYEAKVLISKVIHISHKFWSKEYEEQCLKQFVKMVEDDVKNSEFSLIKKGF